MLPARSTRYWDLGADVIKVGTAARSAGANAPEHPYYTMWNRNKRSVTINMAAEEGRAFARKWLRMRCDHRKLQCGVLNGGGWTAMDFETPTPGSRSSPWVGWARTAPGKTS